MPAFMPVAKPFFSLGKKKLMLAMLELKLPPPKPHNSASTSSVGYEVVESCRAKPMPSAGINKVAVEMAVQRSEEHTSELKSLMRISYAVFCLKKKLHKGKKI